MRRLVAPWCFIYRRGGSLEGSHGRFLPNPGCLKSFPATRSESRLNVIDASGVRGTAIARLARIVKPGAVGQEILTVKEVSELLKIHHSTVYKMIREKRIPAFKIGSDWRFRMDVIASWMAEQTRDAT